MLKALTFLDDSGEATISDFTRSGWNRRTIGKILRNLMELDLVERNTTSDFPSFRKPYSLNASGTYIAQFANVIQKECSKYTGIHPEIITQFPKGCMRLLVYFSRRGWRGVSDFVRRTDLSPNQAYKCLKAMTHGGILVNNPERRSERTANSYEMAPRAKQISILFDALEGALERTLRA